MFSCGWGSWPVSLHLWRWYLFRILCLPIKEFAEHLMASLGKLDSHLPLLSCTMLFVDQAVINLAYHHISLLWLHWFKIWIEFILALLQYLAESLIPLWTCTGHVLPLVPYAALDLTGHFLDVISSLIVCWLEEAGHEPCFAVAGVVIFIELLLQQYWISNCGSNFRRLN